MDQPTTAELLELIMMAEASIDTQFQFWLTVTFATIVASFASRDLLTSSMRSLVVTLYILATFVLASRWYYDAQDIFQYAAILDTRGFVNEPPLTTLYSRVGLMVLGTIATLYFVFTPAREV